MTTKILAILAGLLAALSGMDVIPFLSPAVGVIIIGGASALYGVLMFVGDWLDDKMMNKSFMPASLPFIKTILDAFKKKD